MPGRSGGARPGAGRKPKEPAEADYDDPLEFLRAVMRGTVDPSPAQLKAAIAATQYVHAKKGEGGKREDTQREAERAAGGKFAAAAPPKLTAVK